LTSAVAGDGAKIVYVSGTITGNTVIKVGSNTSVLGKFGASLVGVGLRINKKNNVIVRNLKISKVLTSAGDALGIQEASKVTTTTVFLMLLMVAHVYRSRTRTCTTTTRRRLLDKKITMTYALNKFSNLNSRMPSFRFGTGYLFNNYFVDSNDGINTRLGAQLLVENVWEGVKKPLYATDEGFAVARGNDFGGASNAAPTGTFTKAPYSYSLLDASKVKSTVSSSAGATLDF
ncbi:hypothetical protein FRC11_000664, partial [Ceratobasidium sp. 423]